MLKAWLDLMQLTMQSLLKGIPKSSGLRLRVEKFLINYLPWELTGKCASAHLKNFGGWWLCQKDVKVVDGAVVVDGTVAPAIVVYIAVVVDAEIVVGFGVVVHVVIVGYIALVAVAGAAVMVVYIDLVAGGRAAVMVGYIALVAVIVVYIALVVENVLRWC